MCIASVFAAVALLLAVSLLGMLGRMGDRSTVVFVRNFSWDQLLDLIPARSKGKSKPR